MCRFLNDRREKVRSENPSLTFTEITKLLASEWSKLPADQKQVFTTSFTIASHNISLQFSNNIIMQRREMLAAISGRG